MPDLSNDDIRRTRDDLSRMLGAGAVGMEFASVFSRFGSKVTVVELLDRVLPLEDAAVSAEVEKAFRRRAKACHPDTGGDPREFRKVQWAVQVLRRYRPRDP